MHFNRRWTRDKDYVVLNLINVISSKKIIKMMIVTKITNLPSLSNTAPSFLLQPIVNELLKKTKMAMPAATKAKLKMKWLHLITNSIMKATKTTLNKILKWTNHSWLNQKTSSSSRQQAQMMKKTRIKYKVQDDLINNSHVRYLVGIVCIYKDKAICLMIFRIILIYCLLYHSTEIDRISQAWQTTTNSKGIMTIFKPILIED